MDVLRFSMFNGRNAGVAGRGAIPGTTLAISSVCATPSNFWSSTENGSIGAWYVYFGDGNTNNNNKHNSNAIRPVAALDTKTKEGWLAAYHDCCRAKKSSHNCNLYRVDFEADLWRLVGEIYTHQYKPSTSTCFMVTRPRLREVFAAAFRDRIVQHWICLRLEPLFEKRFKAQGDKSHNCRKGYGTSSAIAAFERDIEQITEGWTKPAWVGKMDIKSFFMSIDTRLLWEQYLRPFIEAEYHGDDKALLLELTEITITHQPQTDCIIKSPEALWVGFPSHKSLRGKKELTGVAIGNITSQLIANFFMSFFVDDLKTICAKYGALFEEFVDDFPIAAPTAEAIPAIHREAQVVLREKYHLHLHSNKFYCQKATHGVKLVGQVIKPHRRYISNSTVAPFIEELERTERLCARIAKGEIATATLNLLRHRISSINSYLGFMVHTASIKLRARLFKKYCREFFKICYCIQEWSIAKIRAKYNINIHLLTQEINSYGMDLHRNRAAAHRGQKVARTKASHPQLPHPGGNRRPGAIQMAPRVGNP